jgi:antitoxin (DNA-binding transcriptional repressor) of toxin-antitoxin stability system
VIAVGIRELKNRLSEYLRMVKAGEEILITHRGEIVAELRKPGRRLTETPYPGLLPLAEQGKVRLGADNRPDLYPRFEPILGPGVLESLLSEERGER